MSLVMSIVFVLGLFAVLGLITWASVAYEMSRAALTMPRSTHAPHDAAQDHSRELVGQLAG